MYKTRKYIVTLLSLFIVLLLTLPVSARTGSGDASWRKTVETFIQIPCMSCEEVDFGKNVIRGLDYNSQRIFRKMSLLPGANFTRSQRAWDALFRLHLSYEQMLTFEDWVDLDETTMELAIGALPEIKSLNYEAGKSFRAFLGIQGVKPKKFAIDVNLCKVILKALIFK